MFDKKVKLRENFRSEGTETRGKSNERSTAIQTIERDNLNIKIHKELTSNASIDPMRFEVNNV